VATHRLSISVNDGSQAGVTPIEVTKTADGVLWADLVIADSVTDQETVFAMDFSALEYIYIHSDQTITIETNAADATGGQAITITADVPFYWHKNSGITNPITADIITNIFITNASGSTANITIRGLQDSTP